MVGHTAGAGQWPCRGAGSSALCDSCWGFHGPTCMPRRQSLAATLQGPEEGHQGGTPGLVAIPWYPGHMGWDSRTQGSPMEWGWGEGSRVSCNFARLVTSFLIKEYRIQYNRKYLNIENITVHFMTTENHCFHASIH